MLARLAPLLALLICLTGSTIASGQPQQWERPPELTIDVAQRHVAVIETSLGTMEVELFADEAPVTVNNFVFLAREGFYDGVVFHRIIQNFMVQSGDPRGNGTGGPGYRFADEPVTRPYDRGTVAMANAGPNTNGSQFFIVHGETVAGSLPPNYTIFGMVISGLDVLDAIAEVPVEQSRNGEPSSPIEPVWIDRVTIVVSDPGSRPQITTEAF
jgi:cyclophilin family peptidyl-prolyl cis-trans isomerase